MEENDKIHQKSDEQRKAKNNFVNNSTCKSGKCGMRRPTSPNRMNGTYLEQKYFKLRDKITNFRKECTKDYFTLSLGQEELLTKIEKYFTND